MQIHVIATYLLHIPICLKKLVLFSKWVISPMNNFF